MGWLISVAGAILVLLSLRDMFHRIWHPSGQGTISRLVLQAVWRGTRLLKSRSEQTSVIGPAALLAVILTWALLILFGWTLIYWPHMAEGFSFGSSLNPAQRGDFADSLYVSLVTLATLGYGDIVPIYGWLRMLAPVEAFIGFALLTAAVSWVLQVYPALARRRVLAIRLSLLEKAGTAGALSTLDSSAASTLLHSLAEQLAQVRVDLTQYSETYYFREADVVSSLPAKLPYVLDLTRAASRSARADVRLAAAVLDGALHDYVTVLTQQLVEAGEDLEESLGRYAADHGYAT
ncbi:MULTISPECIES: potassium channel family protein [unclassified Modestobacter]|uniref:potassium channel family protein n=1 Tax=unclassified Modestobacter TaxID=2643866 RepID=UPI0022AA71FD|nr:MULTISPECIES: potassium channel family protein [unclassified Modestobacter]MCZ2825871.1 potassium channel family protein [Modestobacter sp. VKM Ac-2981]MCZ2853064.1 potassium channel family protein [Modestobacter sp. VKM Ac-2982]